MEGGTDGERDRVMDEGKGGGRGLQEEVNGGRKVGTDRGIGGRNDGGRDTERAEGGMEAGIEGV